MTKRPWLAVAALAAGAALLAGCAGSVPSAEPSGEATIDSDWLEELEPIELSYSSTSPPNSHWSDTADAYMEYITEKTDGKVTFTTYWSASLLPFAEVYSGVGSGQADIAYGSGIGFEQQFPVLSWLSPALSVDPQGHPLNDMINYSATLDLVENNELIQAEYEALNVKPVYFASGPPGDMLCKEPADSLEKASEMNTRSAGAFHTAELEALGMTAASMAFTELYEGLQRGVIDCVITSGGATSFVGYGLNEVAQYFHGLNAWTPSAAAGYVMNLDRWNAFPPELQEVFNEAAAVVAAKHQENVLKAMAEFATTTDETGIIFTDVSELTPVIREHQEKVYENLAETAPAAITDPEAFLEEVQALRAEWKSMLEEIIEGENRGLADTGDELKAAYAEGADRVDWEAYREALAEHVY